VGKRRIKLLTMNAFIPFESAKRTLGFCTTWVKARHERDRAARNRHLPKSHAPIGDARAGSMQSLQVLRFCMGWVWVAGSKHGCVASGATFDAAFTISNSAHDALRLRWSFSRQSEGKPRLYQDRRGDACAISGEFGKNSEM
jgi:hypothetical protein